MQTGEDTTAAAPLRSPVVVSAVLGLPGVAYVGWALVPWLRGTLVGPEGGNGLAVLAAALLLLGAAVACAAAGAALLAGRRRRIWAGLLVLSVAALAWLVGPAGSALTSAALD